MRWDFRILACVVALSPACDGDDLAAPRVPESDARQVAEDAVGGVSESAALVRDVEPPHWLVDLAMSNGGAIEAKVHADEGRLLELEAFEGPYDYMFTPVDGVLSFTEMKSSALDEIDGDVVAWKFFEREAELYFEFYIRDANGDLYEVIFDAVDGAPTDIEKVPEVHP